MLDSEIGFLFFLILTNIAESEVKCRKNCDSLIKLSSLYGAVYLPYVFIEDGAGGVNNYCLSS